MLAGCALSYLGFIEPSWSLVKPKTSSKVVDWDMGSRGGDKVWKCWTGLKGFMTWLVVYSLGSWGLLCPSVHLLVTVDPSLEPKVGSTVWGY